MEVMKEWVKNIFILILALTFIEMLLPTSRMEKYIKFIFSLGIICLLYTSNTCRSPLNRVFIFRENSEYALRTWQS